MANRLEIHFTNGDQLSVEGEVNDFRITNRMAGNALISAKEGEKAVSINPEEGEKAVSINPEHIVYIRDHGPMSD